MAPALPDSAREPDAFTDTDAVRATDNPSQPHRRRALTSVDNLGLHMDDEDMGLQSAANLSKDSQEMDQILVDLGGSDLAQADLLQAIKTLETGGDVLSTGDADAIFPLSGFDLTESVEPESVASEDKIRAMQVRLDRRCAFLQRRLRILQARAIGKRVSEEAAQSFEKSSRGARRDGCGRPMGLKALLKRIETTAALQANAASRSMVGPSYFHAGTSSTGDVSRSASIGVPTGTLTGLEDTAGALRSHLSVVKHELDSDATATSSGAESNDEAVTYNNPHQRHMPIEKRALWSWQRTRASIASRWCWLQAQIQELEYKIRQHTDLHNQVRTAKGPVELEGSPVAYEEPLPGAESPTIGTCARVRALQRDTFKKRKLLQLHNLHMATAKAAKPADIRCGCDWPMEGCAVCTGRAVATEPYPPHSTLVPVQTLALLDPAYHPVLSDIQDVSPSIHLAALSSRAWFRSRSVKSTRGAHHAPTTTHNINTLRKPTRLKRGRPPLSRKIRDIEPDTATTTHEPRPRGRPSSEGRHLRVNSYDIDNIVIPQSMAATTRPEILHYKEILTPKWRVMEIPTSLNNGVLKSRRASGRHSSDTLSMDSEIEDISEASISARHSRAEATERGRFLLNSRTRRSHHHEDTQHILQMVEAPERGRYTRTRRTQRRESGHREGHQEDISHHEIVRPYTPREFPLPEQVYLRMLSEMPPGHVSPPASPPGSPPVSPPVSPLDDPESSLSPLSPLQYQADDPGDAEWNPSSEKHKRTYFRC